MSVVNERFQLSESTEDGTDDRDAIFSKVLAILFLTNKVLCSISLD